MENLAQQGGVWAIRHARMEILLNGERKAIEEHTSLAALLLQLGLEGQPVAVEMNGRIVRRQYHANTLLFEGDKLEIVTFVGGG